MEEVFQHFLLNTSSDLIYEHKIRGVKQKILKTWIVDEHLQFIKDQRRCSKRQIC